MLAIMFLIIGKKKSKSFIKYYKYIYNPSTASTIYRTIQHSGIKDGKLIYIIKSCGCGF